MTSYNCPEQYNCRQQLGLLQDGLRSAITLPGALDAGLNHLRPLLGTQLQVKAGDQVEARERLTIYAHGYLTRLLEYLRADYPATHAFLGAELFNRFAAEYLWSTPPHHYSLFTVGADFVDHLERTRPADGAVPHAQRCWLQLPIDLARVERARLQALRAPGLEGSTAESAPPLHPWEFLLPGNDIVLTAAPCLHVVPIEHDVTEFIAAVDAALVPPPPRAGSIVLAVSRYRFRPTLTPLTAWQAGVLEQCQQPQPFTSLLAEQMQRADAEALRAELALWMPLAQERGLLTLQHARS